MPGRFLVAEFEAPEMPMAAFTARHPGTSVDLVLEPQGPDRSPLHRGIFFAKGVTDPLMAELRAETEAAYDQVETLRRDRAARTWMATVRVREQTDWPAAAQALAAFQQRTGTPWVHVEDGVVYMRAALREEADGPGLVADLEAELARRGALAQVAVQEVGAADFGVWKDIVEASRTAL